MKKEILSSLTKVASETRSIDAGMSDDLNKLAAQLTSALSDDDLDAIVDHVEKTATIEKEAKLINEGDVVICVDNFPPMFKGRRYIVSDASIPGFISIKEMECDGSGDVGIFAVNRFSIDWNAQ